MTMNSESSIEIEIKKIKDKISEIEENMAKLAIEKLNLDNQLIGVELAIKFLNKPLQMTNSLLRPNSELSKIYNILFEVGIPLHIDIILEKLGLGNDNNKKLSLVGSLAKYAKNRRIFERCGPNIFGLLRIE